MPPRVAARALKMGFVEDEGERARAGVRTDPAKTPEKERGARLAAMFAQGGSVRVHAGQDGIVPERVEDLMEAWRAGAKCARNAAATGADDLIEGAGVPTLGLPQEFKFNQHLRDAA